jgi:hypothetical protein
MRLLGIPLGSSPEEKKKTIRQYSNDQNYKKDTEQNPLPITPEG